jgi:hypothetical protein
MNTKSNHNQHQTQQSNPAVSKYKSLNSKTVKNAEEKATIAKKVTEQLKTLIILIKKLQKTPEESISLKKT